MSIFNNRSIFNTLKGGIQYIGQYIGAWIQYIGAQPLGCFFKQPWKKPSEKKYYF
jgi:hypothetical protein